MGSARRYSVTPQVQSVFRTEAKRRYPSAEVIGDGPWGVVLDAGKFVDLYPTRAQAAWNGDSVEYFGREFKHRMDTERDD